MDADGFSKFYTPLEERREHWQTMQPEEKREIIEIITDKIIIGQRRNHHKPLLRAIL